jgi:1-carboxybiuret hydrolase
LLAAWQSATEIAEAVANGRTSALAVIEAALERIRGCDGQLNAFTAITGERALAKARAIDLARAQGKSLGALAGVPFAVKNLFDVAGLPTLAGSKLNRRRAAAERDAPLISRLEAADAVLVGTLNMGEYAYDFTGENVHYGPSRNPHDLTRMAGGSSGGSAAAVAGGLVPLALGSDTNGSIRVPASFCGIFGLKPTYGRLTRSLSFPFVASLDHLGPLARSSRDLAIAYDLMQGPDPSDPACAQRPVEPVLPSLEAGTGAMRIAVAGGYFKRGATPAALQGVARIAAALAVSAEVEIAEAARARAAAYILTAAEGAALHLDRLRSDAAEFDPAVRDRLLAGAMLPAPFVARAQKFRRWYHAEVLKLFDSFDAIVAPATPFAAPRIGQQSVNLDGAELPLRPNIGIFTQPISFIGLPVVAVPVALQPLPIAVQIIAPPWREDVALRIAHSLEKAGVVLAPRPAK